jgi:hypothetical protein
MYTVLFPNGNTLVFSVRAVAETYVVAYRGVLISDVVVDTNPVAVV